MVSTEAQVHPYGAMNGSAGVPDSTTRNAAMLFLASFLALYFEVVVIRYLSTEIRVFAYLKNLPLISSFLLLDLGMAMAFTQMVLKRLFPLLTATLLILMVSSPTMQLS